VKKISGTPLPLPPPLSLLMVQKVLFPFSIFSFLLVGAGRFTALTQSNLQDHQIPLRNMQ